MTDIAIEAGTLARALAGVIERYGAEACGGGVSAEQAAQQWIDAGFDDAEEVEDWLRARCFSAGAARALEDAGITPEQAATPIRAGSSGDGDGDESDSNSDRDVADTLAGKFTRGHISIDEARRIVTNDFWNS